MLILNLETKKNTLTHKDHRLFIFFPFIRKCWVETLLPTAKHC